MEIGISWNNSRLLTHSTTVESFIYKMKMKKCLAATISRLLSFSKFGKTKMSRRRLTLNQTINWLAWHNIFLSMHFLSDTTSTWYLQRKELHQVHNHYNAMSSYSWPMTRSLDFSFYAYGSTSTIYELVNRQYIHYIKGNSQTSKIEYE